MSVELCFLIELLSDFSLIWAAARSMGCFRLQRCAMASALAALYGVLARAVPMLSGPQVQLVLLLPLSMLVSGSFSLQVPATCALTLAVTAIVTGTCAASIAHVPLALATIPALCALTTRLRRSLLSSLPTRVEVVNQGHTAVLNALIDTGNRLTEPLSGQPVLIANANLLRGVLPQTGYRQVAYGSIGGKGLLHCFRPDRVYISFQGHRLRAPDTWIAPFPDRLPGIAQALAPAEFLLR